MKSSKYNIFIPYKAGTVVMNCLRDSSIYVESDATMDALKQIIKNPEDQDGSFDHVINGLKQNGFIVDDELDEALLAGKKLEAKTMKDIYTMMILPTYQCNLRCWYCTQNHADSYMSDDTFKAIKKRLEKFIKDSEIKHIYIYWFGGEPMIAYDKVVDLNRWIIDMCKEHDKTFGCSITTNSTLLNSERIKELHEAGVTSYQITVDGERSLHNNIKKLGKISAFDVAMSNIGEIAKYGQCTLRYNYTRENFNPESMIRDIDAALPKENRNNIVFSIHRVWQEETNCVGLEELLHLMDLAMSIGLLPRLATPDLCYTDQYHFDCVFSDGRVGKCDNSPSEDAQCVLNQDGELTVDKDIQSFANVLQSGDNECVDCKYLPLCWGPCQAKRQSMLDSDGVVRCQFDDKEKSFPPMALNHHINREYIKKFAENVADRK